jgi:hypothetical protein
MALNDIASNSLDTRSAARNEPTYENGLQPITNMNNDASPKRISEPHSVPARVSTQRGRGRPRKTSPRDESAIEVYKQP